MIELAKHIEYLLLDNDCVIVPDLGGFITHYQPAHYEEVEGIYLPPLRTVGFNPQLTMNDGLLVQSYMQAYHTDYPDALRIVSEKVDMLKETLHKEGVAEMQGIGMLHYTLYGTYEFRPYENGILSPALYALDAFSISPLGAETMTSEKVASTQPEILPDVVVAREKKPFRLHPQWLGNAVAVAVAALLFFILSVPVENTYVDKGVYASLGTDCLFDAIRSQSVATVLSVPEMEKPQQKKVTEVKPIVTKVEKIEVAPQPEVSAKPQKVQAKAVAPKVEKKPKTASPTKEAPKQEVRKAVGSSKQYHLIVASLTTSQDAKRMQQEYKQQGFAHATIIESNGRFRISLCHYADKAQAYGKLNELKQKDAFKNAWMLSSK